MEQDEASERLRAHLAEQPGVRLAYLIGSRATGRAAPESDWDVAVLFESGVAYRRRFGLQCDLEELTGTKVDLVPLDRAPIEFAEQIVRKGKLLFARSDGERVEFEATTMSRAFDMWPELERQRREILEGRPHDRAVERYRALFGKTRGMRE